MHFVVDKIVGSGMSALIFTGISPDVAVVYSIASELTYIGVDAVAKNIFNNQTEVGVLLHFAATFGISFYVGKEAIRKVGFEFSYKDALSLLTSRYILLELVKIYQSLKKS